MGTFFAARASATTCSNFHFDLHRRTKSVPAPSSPGVSICTAGRPPQRLRVLVEVAAGNVSGTLARMELWVDGVKKYTETTSLWFKHICLRRCQGITTSMSSP